MKTLLEIFQERSDLSKFFDLLEKAELRDALSAARRLTVFAPNDDAFAAAPQDIIADYFKIFYTTRQLATHHIILGAYNYNQLLVKAKQDVETTAQTKLRLTDTYGVVRVAGSKIIEQDIEGKNGMLHILDRVLLPTEKLK